jgi:hypothetical protein
MRNRRAAPALLAGSLLIGAGGMVACDNEDKKDAEEIVNDADKELDKLDSDGKDD